MGIEFIFKAEFKGRGFKNPTAPAAVTGSHLEKRLQMAMPLSEWRGRQSVTPGVGRPIPS